MQGFSARNQPSCTLFSRMPPGRSGDRAGHQRPAASQTVFGGPSLARPSPIRSPGCDRRASATTRPPPPSKTKLLCQPPAHRDLYPGSSAPPTPGQTGFRGCVVPARTTGAPRRPPRSPPARRPAFRRSPILPPDAFEGFDSRFTVPGIGPVLHQALRREFQMTGSHRHPIRVGADPIPRIHRVLMLVKRRLGRAAGSVRG